MKIVVLSGAGISADSGIATFRGAGGLWEGHRIEEVASLKGWNKNRELVLDFYNKRRKIVLESNPNEAHEILVELENSHEALIFFICTVKSPKVEAH